MKGFALVRLFLVAGIVSVGALGFSQDAGGASGSGTQPTNGSSSTATGSGTATSTSNNQIIQNSTSRQLPVTAIPGGIPGAYPGFAPENTPCYMYNVAGLPPLTNAILTVMAKGGKLPRGTDVTSMVDPNSTPDNGGKDGSSDHAIALTTYNIRAFHNEQDRILGSIIAPGKFHHTDEQLLALGLLRLQKETKGLIRRASVITCGEAESVTKANTLGFGGVVSETPSGGTTEGSVAVGFTHGTSKTSKQVHSTMYIYALNDGHAELDHPPTLPQPQAPAPAPAPAPTVQTVRIEVVPVAPPPQPIAPAPVPAVDPCSGFPHAVVYFVFNHYDVEPRYQPEIEKIRDWMEQHPSCRVQIEGYADHVAGYPYNAELGRKRAKAVYDILAKDEKIRENLSIYFSAGKDFAKGTLPGKENQPDRKVVFAIRSVTSENGSQP